MNEHARPADPYAQLEISRRAFEKEQEKRKGAERKSETLAVMCKKQAKEIIDANAMTLNLIRSARMYLKWAWMWKRKAKELPETRRAAEIAYKVLADNEQYCMSLTLTNDKLKICAEVAESRVKTLMKWVPQGQLCKLCKNYAPQLSPQPCETCGDGTDSKFEFTDHIADAGKKDHIGEPNEMIESE